MDYFTKFYEIRKEVTDTIINNEDSKIKSKKLEKLLADLIKLYDSDKNSKFRIEEYTYVQGLIDGASAILDNFK